MIQRFLAQHEPHQAAFRTGRQPDRRRRSGGAASQRREGTGRKFPRRRRTKNHRGNRRGRAQPDPRYRRRHRHEPRRCAALPGTARNEQNYSRGGFSLDCHDGFSRRSTAQHRQRQPVHADHARTGSRFARRHTNHRQRRHDCGSQSRRQRHRHEHRGPPAFLQPAGPPEISTDGGDRGRAHPALSHARRAGVSRSCLHLRQGRPQRLATARRCGAGVPPVRHWTKSHRRAAGPTIQPH